MAKQNLSENDKMSGPVGAVNTGHTANKKPVIVRDRGAEILKEYGYDPVEIDSAPKVTIDPEDERWRSVSTDD